jgi:eukaryotic-like serine/threonine-protein kinase
MFKLPPAQWQRLRACLDDAMALPPQARAAWLQGLSGEDEALRPQLEALLAEAAAQGMASGPGLIERGPMLPGTSDSALGIPGAWVGPYQLRSLLGRGGPRACRCARPTRPRPCRRVALKLPNGDQWRRGLGERLTREREILATLEHPNIARLYEAGESADGQPYIALEFVDGERIDEHVEHQGLSTAQRIGLFLQVCDAVAHAHARLVVHRDLKPANILVDRQGRVKLLDFGIARLLDASAAPDSELTTAHGSPMTPRYAAPEQRRGEAMGTAVDIYVLGLVLMELLIGRQARDAAPLPGDVDATQAPAGELPRASELAASAALRDALRGDLDTIIGKALRQEAASTLG